MYENEEENSQEHARMIIALRAEGWSDTKIIEFMLYVASGEQSRYEAFLKNE